MDLLLKYQCANDFKKRFCKCLITFNVGNVPDTYTESALVSNAVSVGART